MYNRIAGSSSKCSASCSTRASPAMPVFLWTLPMFHCNGWCLTWGLTGIGATHVCLRKVDPAVVWPLLEREAVTLQRLRRQSSSPGNHSLSGVTLKRPLTVTTGGAPPSPTLIAQMQELGAELVHVCGLTEMYGPSTLCEVNPEWSRCLPRSGRV